MKWLHVRHGYTFYNVKSRNVMIFFYTNLETDLERFPSRKLYANTANLEE